MKRATALTVLGLFALIACTGGMGDHAEPADHAAPAGLTDDDRAAIRASDEAWEAGFNAGDMAMVGAQYTEDAILLPPNAPIVQGRAAIEAFFSGFPPVSDVVLTLEEIEGEGDTAWVRGSYTMNIHVEEGAEPIADVGKFVEIRKRQADGSWLLARDVYNSDLAPAAE